MFNHYVIAIGTSAGGIGALEGLISRLPHDFPAAIFIVMHLQPFADSRLPQIINKYSKIPVSLPKDDQAIEANRIYIAPPNLHMLIRNEKIKIQYGPKINNSRPAIDPLFYSVAEFGQKAIGILLSGMLDDGCAGLHAIKSNQGIAIAQDSKEAEYPEMPTNAAKHVKLDYQLPTAAIAEVLTKIVYTTKPTHKVNKLVTAGLSQQNPLTNHSIDSLNQIGAPSVYACPTCHGVLWEINNQQLTQYQCHVGHHFSLDSLASAIDSGTEEALWAALRALEEKEYLAKKIAEKAARDRSETTDFFQKKAANTEKHVKMIYKILNEES